LIQPDPARSRVFVRFTDETGAVRGSTSIAIEGGVNPLTTLGATLDGAQVVPPTSSHAHGFGFFRLSEFGGTLTFDIDVFDLEGPEVSAHIHGPAAPGTTGPVVFSLPPGSPKSGTLTLTSAQRAQLRAGLWYVDVHTTAFPDGEIRGQISEGSIGAAVLPSSRSVQVGAPAAAFATIVNTGFNDATGCSIALGAPIPAGFVYQTTNPATNTLTGTANTPADIPAGGRQTFFFAITPTAPIAPTDVPLVFQCANTSPAPSLGGIDTLLLSASATPVPDVIAVALAGAAFQPGEVVLDEARQGAFVVSATNVGAAAVITITADTGAATLPVAISMCETTPAGGCAAPPSAAITRLLATGGGVGLAVFVSGTGWIEPDAARNRISVRFTDAGGVTRGSTSVAVR
jgi:hypothetical protein